MDAPEIEDRIIDQAEEDLLAEEYEYFKRRERPTCPRCKKKAKLVTGLQLYGSDATYCDLREKQFWTCPKRHAWVGCHQGTSIPMGTLADKETRSARGRAHSVLDDLWKTGKMSRGRAYSLARKLLGWKKTPHVGGMTQDECERLVEILARWMKETGFSPW